VFVCVRVACRPHHALSHALVSNNAYSACTSTQLHPAIVKLRAILERRIPIASLVASRLHASSSSPPCTPQAAKSLIDSLVLELLRTHLPQCAEEVKTQIEGLLAQMDDCDGHQETVCDDCDRVSGQAVMTLTTRRLSDMCAGDCATRPFFLSSRRSLAEVNLCVSFDSLN